MTTIDHKAEAERVLENAPHDNLSNNQDAFAWAQIHATLALAEQTRIANLIALEAATEPRNHASYILHNAQDDPDASFPNYQIRPYIARVLGLDKEGAS